MITKIGIVLGASVICGLLYFAGGQINKAIRRFGCSLVFALLCLFLGLYSHNLWLNIGIYLLAYILNALAFSTYHDYLAPDGSSENWLCWLMTGLVYGLAAFPLFWLGVHWWAILIRAVFLALTIMWLRERTGKVFWEEVGSGFLYCISIPILLI